MTNDSQTHREESNDVIPDNADEARGRAKEAFGALTGDEKLQQEGKADRAEGTVKDKIDDLADKAKRFVDDVRGRIDR